MKYIIINDIKFIIQSYLIADFCYLVSEEMSSIRIDFSAYHLGQSNNHIFSSYQKTDKKWCEFVNKIDVEQIEKELIKIFDPICHV